ncbi:hypothetical protein [Methyloraptor flagellatus]|uniref:Uncharacterized protein n=1 Tax=Methyloraptor flagellatus TaxID=3162530 RepID=A0AAU7X893_9HYPH
MTVISTAARSGAASVGLLLLLTLRIGSEAVEAAERRPLSYASEVQTVGAGQTTPLNPVFMSFDTKCRSKPRPMVTLVDGPHLGAALPRAGLGAASFGPGPWAKCDGKIGKAAVLFYQAGRTPGVDRFSVRVLHADGSVVYVPFTIVVEKR